MINQDKPNVSTPQTELNIGDGFNLLVGDLFKLIVGAMGMGGMTNATKASIGETWGTISTTWASESQTWLEASQLITNASLSLTDPLWSYRTFPWQLTAPWAVTSTGITNQAKP